MISFIERISLQSKNETEAIDITNNVQGIVSKSKVKHGHVNIYAGHASAAIIINEHEGGLIKDLINLLEVLVPKNGSYLHNRVDVNAHSHLHAILIGTNKTIPVVAGLPIPGKWQRGNVH